MAPKRHELDAHVVIHAINKDILDYILSVLPFSMKLSDENCYKRISQRQLWKLGVISRCSNWHRAYPNS